MTLNIQAGKSLLTTSMIFILKKKFPFSSSSPLMLPCLLTLYFKINSKCHNQMSTSNVIIGQIQTSDIKCRCGLSNVNINPQRQMSIVKFNVDIKYKD